MPRCLLRGRKTRTFAAGSGVAGLTQWPVSLRCCGMVSTGCACLASCLICGCVAKTCNFQRCLLLVHWELRTGQELPWWRTDGVLWRGRSQHPPAELPKASSGRQPIQVLLGLEGQCGTVDPEVKKTLLRKASVLSYGVMVVLEWLGCFKRGVQSKARRPALETQKTSDVFGDSELVQ